MKCKACSKKNQADYDGLAGWHYQDGLGWLFGQVEIGRVARELKSAGIAYKAKHPEKAKAWDAWEKKAIAFANAHKEDRLKADAEAKREEGSWGATKADVLDELNEKAKHLDKEFEQLDTYGEDTDIDDARTWAKKWKK